MNLITFARAILRITKQKFSNTKYERLNLFLLIERIFLKKGSQINIVQATYEETNRCYKLLVSDTQKMIKLSLREKCPNTEFFSGPYIPSFGLNAGKYGPEKTPDLDTFHTVFNLGCY